MVYKNGRPLLKIFPFFITLCIFIVPFAFAQEDTVDAVTNELAPIVQEGQVSEDGERDSFYEETSDGIVFVQRLLWDEVPYAYRYDVVIEKQIKTKIESEEQTEAVQWQLVDTINTKNNMVEVSFLTGIYRYKIIVYNLFDMPELESKWFEIDIIRAIQPKINSIFPEVMYLDEENSGIFRIEGENIMGNAIYTLEMLEFPEQTLVGILIESDNQNKWAKVQFNVEDMNLGEYTLVVENAGGLRNTEVSFVVNCLSTNLAKVPAVKRDQNFSVSIGYSVSWLPSDGNIFNYFNTGFAPFGANVRITYIPVKRNFGYFGFELTAHAFRVEGKKDDYKIVSNNFPVNLNFVYQFPFIKDRLVLDTNIGIGINFFNDLHFAFDNGSKTSPLNAIGISANAGLALQVYIYKGLYTEIGIDYIIVILEDAMIQMIAPSVSIGWQF